MLIPFVNKKICKILKFITVAGTKFGGLSGACLRALRWR